MANVHRMGFTRLSCGNGSDDQFSLNVIFIHGLRGHPRGTWEAAPATSGDSPKTHRSIKSLFKPRAAASLSTGTEQSQATKSSSKIFWPEHYLAPEIFQARIWTYGYNADVIGDLFQANNKNSISQHGRDLAVKLERDIGDEKPIVFVAHSLGGIIVKDAMHRSEKCRERTKLIVFLGTPHRGSTYASWGQIVSNLARLAFQDSNKTILETLEVNSEVLDNIHENFKNIVFKGGIKIHSFQEAQGIAGMKGLDKKVVDDFSSKLDLPTALETVESIDANHMQMARYYSKNDQGYRAISGVLKSFVRQELNSAKEILSVVSAAKVVRTVTIDEADRGQTMSRTSFSVPFPKNNRSEPRTTQSVDETTMYETLRSAIDSLNLHQFLLMLSALDQDEHISAIPHLDRDPMFCWIFRNMDFSQWRSAKCSQVLWLSGLPERNIHQVSSYIVDQEKDRVLKTDHIALYFFCSSAIGGRSIVADFVHTLLEQIVCCLPMDKRILVIRSFLHNLLEEAFKKNAASHWEKRGFCEQDTLHTKVKNILNAPTDELFTAFEAVLRDEEQRSLSLVVDGLDKVEHQRDFIRRVRAFIDHLQQRTSKVKILLTSQPLAEIKDLLNGLPCIEHDRERKECLASLRFYNTRYDKISREHEGSFKWIWAHDEYRNWSTPDASRLLHIEGKPGSGKSTIARYFSDHFLELEEAPKSVIVAKFFYSDREGKPQRSHYNMLRSILYDILDQDEAFFYHHFQTEYRLQRRRGFRVNWEYVKLESVLKSLQDHSPARRLYLIIDAVDESEEKDRRDVLNLLFELCSKTKYCIVKVFVASRPVGQFEPHKVHNLINLQDETKSDISSFAHSLLDRLNLTHVLAQATEYIVENAEGVFLWVKLVGEELLTCKEQGFSEEDMIEFLKWLPKELEVFYTLMFERMNTNKPGLRNPRNLQDLRNLRDLQDGVKLFRFVLFARRPLTVDELRHALIIPSNLGTKFTPSDDSLQEYSLPSKQRIIYGGGNFLEIKTHHGSEVVQVMHQSVRDFFFNPNGPVVKSKFALCKKDAHACIAITCIRYLMVCVANTPLARGPPDITWTSEHFKSYAQYLDTKPLAKYALGHLKHHIDGCQQDAEIRDITSQFISRLTHNHDVYLLESWVSSHLNKILLSNERGAAAKDFRDKVLHVAARNGFSTAAEVLLTTGADVNAKGVGGWTALHLAAWVGHEAVARLLVVEGKAHVNAEDASGWTALHRAAERGHEAVARLLVVEGKADVNEKGGAGWTALHWAAGGGHEAVVRLLVVEGKADVNAKGEAGRTALHWAAQRGHEAVVRLLVVEGNAYVNAVDGARWTALHWAVERGHKAVARLLEAYERPS